MSMAYQLPEHFRCMPIGVSDGVDIICYVDIFLVFIAQVQPFTIFALWKIHRPKNISTGYNTFKHKHDKIKRPRDFKRYGDQKKGNQYHDNTGLSTVTYNDITRHESVIDGAPVTVLNVILNCDYEETPWCTHRQYIAKMENDKHAKKREMEATNAKIALAQQQIVQAKRQMRDLEREEREEGNVR